MKTRTLNIIKITPQVHTWGSISYKKKKKIHGGKDNNIRVIFFILLIVQVNYVSTIFFNKDNFIACSLFYEELI